jgi:hypothetical protein
LAGVKLGIPRSSNRPFQFVSFIGGTICSFSKWRIQVKGRKPRPS